MKATGIVRKVDELGRIVLPKELRRKFKIDEKDPLEIFVDEDNQIILRKYEPGCSFCGETDGLVEHWNKLICKECVKELTKKKKAV